MSFGHFEVILNGSVIEAQSIQTRQKIKIAFFVNGFRKFGMGVPLF